VIERGLQRCRLCSHTRTHHTHTCTRTHHTHTCTRHHTRTHHYTHTCTRTHRRHSKEVEVMERRLPRCRRNSRLRRCMDIRTSTSSSTSSGSNEQSNIYTLWSTLRPTGSHTLRPTLSRGCQPTRLYPQSAPPQRPTPAATAAPLARRLGRGCAWRANSATFGPCATVAVHEMLVKDTIADEPPCLTIKNEAMEQTRKQVQV
jgi:hypothetical protein